MQGIFSKENAFAPYTKDELKQQAVKSEQAKEHLAALRVKAQACFNSEEFKDYLQEFKDRFDATVQQLIFLPKDHKDYDDIKAELKVMLQFLHGVGRDANMR